MIKRLLFSAALLVAVAPATARAQQDRCFAGQPTQLDDACQKAADLFHYMMPQLGTALAGGNATLGQASTLGGLGHFSLGIRATGVLGAIPAVDSVQVVETGRVQSTYPDMKNVPISAAAPGVDLTAGLFRGIPIGIGHLGGLDLIVSAAYLPEVKNEGVSLILPNGSLKIGFGGRLGILQEGSLMPGVAVTYLKRGLPITTIEAKIKEGSDPSLTDTVTVQKLDISTGSWRIVASKKLLILGLAAGYGQDTYNASTSITAVVRQATGPCNPRCAPAPGDALASLTSNVTRTNMFADLSLNLFIFKLVGEVGQVSGGSISTYNKFKKAADATRQYASAGIRFGF